MSNSREEQDVGSGDDDFLLVDAEDGIERQSQSRRADKVYATSNAFHIVPEMTRQERDGRQMQAGGADIEGPSPAVDLLRRDMEVYDASVFAFCQRYLSVHRTQHSKMSKEHSHMDEQRIYDLPSWRARWHALLNLNQKTMRGRIITMVEAAIVLISIFSVVLESMPFLNGDIVPDYATFWLVLEILITVYFTVLTVVRFFVSPSLWSVVKSPMNWADVVSLLPLFVQLAVQNRAYGWLKTLRMFRLIKLLRMFQYIDALAVTLRRIAHSLVAPFVLLGVFVVVFGNIIYWLEGGSLWTAARAAEFLNRTNFTDASDLYALVNATVQPNCLCESTAGYLFGSSTCPPIASKFISAAQGMWYATASFTTVGYGDVVPKCAPGKVATSIALMFSTIFIAMPIAIVGASFAETVVDHHNKIILHKKLKARTIRDLREKNRKLDEQQRELSGGKKDSKRKGKRSKPQHDDSAALAQSNRRVTPAEALLRFVASQLHMENLEFNPELSCMIEEAAVYNSDNVADNTSLLSGETRSTADKADTMTLGTTNNTITSRVLASPIRYRQLPLKAQFRANLVETIDSYCAWLFEHWLLENLRGSEPLTSESVNGSMGGLHHISPFARTGRSSSDAFISNVRRQQRLERLKSARSQLKDTLHNKVGSMHPLLLFQAIDRAIGYQRDVCIPTRIHTTVLGGRLNSETNVLRTKHTISLSSSHADTDEGAPHLQLLSDELWLPYILGRFVLSYTLAQRQLMFVPHGSCIDFISVNGVSLYELAAQQLLEEHDRLTSQHRTTTAAAIQAHGPQSRYDVVLVAQRMRTLATTLDAMHDTHLSAATFAKASTMSAFSDRVDDGASVEERVFSVYLQNGDLIELTPDLRTIDDVTLPPKRVARHKEPGSTTARKRHRDRHSATSALPGQVDEDEELSPEEIAVERARHSKELDLQGIKPIVYRVVLE